jgi:spore germination protein YaaH
VLLPAFFLLLLLAVLGGAAYLYMVRYYPNPQHSLPDFNGLFNPMFYRGEILPESALKQQGSLQLPLTLVREQIDSHIIFDEAGDSAIITTKDKVLRMQTDQLTGYMNEKPFTLQFPVTKADGKVYLPVDPLLSLYPIELRESADTGAIILVKAGDPIQWLKTAVNPEKPQATVAMRSEPNVKAPIVADVEQAADLMLWGEKDGWYRVQLPNGYLGYLPKGQGVIDHVEVVSVKHDAQPHIGWSPVGGKINLTWEQVVTKNPDTAKIGAMPGLNVISPTWFSLQDSEGNIKNLASADYAEWAHERGYQLWALFSNGFEPERTTKALASYDTRMKMIKQLLGFAELYHLQGINLDFENVYTKDKANLTQFVREMTPLLHEQGLVVSIDVTPKSNSEMWSLFYDRKALAESVDYMMVMAYDEHPAASLVSGSVSSLPWAEQSVARILKEDQVPARKLVLAVPFYTRIWTEQPQDGKTKVSSQAVIMSAVNNIIKDQKLTPIFKQETGQNYVEYKDGGNSLRIWIEDEVSIQARMELVRKYGLAGVASWRRGYETPEIWNVISDALSRLP